MNYGPALFSDFGKKAKDLLSKDHLSDRSTFRSYGTVSKTSPVISFGATNQYIYKNATADIKSHPGFDLSGTLTFADIVPSSKTIATLEHPNSASRKLEFQYFHPHASLTAALRPNQVDYSVTLGTPTFALGAEAGFETTSGKMTNYTAGINVTKPDSCVSIVLGDRGNTTKASYIHYTDKLKKCAAVGEITRKFSTNENTFTMGGSYAIDSRTLVKVKLNNHGTLGAVLQREVVEKIAFVNISSEFDTKSLDKTPRFGVSLTLTAP